MSSFLQSIPMIIVTVLAFGLLIVIHELGHYFAARWSGMRVERFSIGFGPVVWSRRRTNSMATCPRSQVSRERKPKVRHSRPMIWMT